MAGTGSYAASQSVNRGRPALQAIPNPHEDIYQLCLWVT